MRQERTFRVAAIPRSAIAPRPKKVTSIRHGPVHVTWRHALRDNGYASRAKASERFKYVTSSAAARPEVAKAFQRRGQSISATSSARVCGIVPL
jgi:hypothetical protein